MAHPVCRTGSLWIKDRSYAPVKNLGLWFEVPPLSGGVGVGWTIRIHDLVLIKHRVEFLEAMFNDFCVEPDTF